MSRQLEQANEERSKKFDRALKLAANGGLADAVERAGGELRGFSFKQDPWECLLTVRATFPAGKMVGFIGAPTLGGCLVKCLREAERDAVRWRADKWG